VERAEAGVLESMDGGDEGRDWAQEALVELGVGEGGGLDEQRPVLEQPRRQESRHMGQGARQRAKRRQEEVTREQQTLEAVEKGVEEDQEQVDDVGDLADLRDPARRFNIREGNRPTVRLSRQQELERREKLQRRERELKRRETEEKRIEKEEMRTAVEADEELKALYTPVYKYGTWVGREVSSRSAKGRGSRRAA
jgi:hypothetical protein